jgi:hypothetical protein
LVQDFHVPRADAESLMRWVRNGSIAAEAEARNEDQFLLDFKRIGAKAMAERHRMTEQGIRKRRTKLQKRNRELRPELRGA